MFVRWGLLSRLFNPILENHFLSDVRIYLSNILAAHYIPGGRLFPQPEDAPFYGERKPITVDVIANHITKHMEKWKFMKNKSENATHFKFF